MILHRLAASLRPPRATQAFSAVPSFDLENPDCNTTKRILSKVGKNLHTQPHHPLAILKKKIVNYWGPDFRLFDDFSPVVSVENNFDMLRIPPDHVSRSYSDTYYLDKVTCLRTHTSAHQVDLLQLHNQFLVTGDVYRRDEIDRSHYPIFHQMEGVKVFDPKDDDFRAMSPKARTDFIEQDLRAALEGLAEHLFGPTDRRWVDAYFPFTHPSMELEIYFQDEWLEVLGCGVIHPDIMVNAKRPDDQGWAFGLGLERLAMVLFDIPDIRLFWSEDKRFRQQFMSEEIVKFQPYSKYPPCRKDMSFWIPDGFHVNDLNELLRDIAGDLVEQVELIDEFVHPKTQRVSHCYRISYRSMDRSLTNEEVDELQEGLRRRTANELAVELR